VRVSSDESNKATDEHTYFFKQTIDCVGCAHRCASEARHWPRPDAGATFLRRTDWV